MNVTRLACRLRPLFPLALCALALAGGCSSAPPRVAAGSAPQAPLAREDVLWLEHASFGLDGRTVADYQRLGRERFLEWQLRAPPPDLPPAVVAQLAGSAPPDALAALRQVRARQDQINALAVGEPQEQARKAFNQDANASAYDAARRELLYALYSRAQLQEQMVWFWLNHFSVYQYKAAVRWLAADYAERAIRPHALGHFSDLVLATLRHPAMLQYLDNAQNAVGHVNENYARELMELHTLGVGAGYTQQDVQQLARVLTGVGINPGLAPRLRREWQGLYLRDGAFEFNPARHDFGPKRLLGHDIRGRGFDEVREAVTLLVRQPACATFISRQLAQYFVADDPPPQLVQRMARAFHDSDGDIAAVLHVMFMDPQFAAALGNKLRDPMRYLVASVRFAYDGRPIANPRPLLNWLGALGEAPFGRLTPDGYPLDAAGWSSPGQMSRRFEIARALGAGSAGLFVPPAAGAPAPAFPQLASRLYYGSVEPLLAVHTRAALAQAASQQEWNALLLASPEFNYE